MQVGLVFENEQSCLTSVSSFSFFLCMMHKYKSSWHEFVTFICSFVSVQVGNTLAAAMVSYDPVVF